MSKRQQLRERQQKRAMTNRLIIIGILVLGAIFIAAFMIIPTLVKSNPGTIVQITPRALATANQTSLGNPQAPVKMDVWEDFQCSGCLSYSKDIEPQVITNYVDSGKVYYTFHFYPFIDGGQGESHDAANSALCANEQGKFWDYHDMLFANWKGENVGSYTKPRLTAFAQALGLDMTRFNSCLQASTYASKIQEDMAAGAKIGVPPTPGIFINGTMVTASAGANYLPTIADIGKAVTAAGG